MASEEPRAATVVDRDGREVVLLARIWGDKITRDHPELVDHLEAVMEKSPSPITARPTRFPTVRGSTDAESGPAAG